MRPGWCNGRASSRSTDRSRISAAASDRISATGWATTRSFRRSTKPSGSACSIATCSAPGLAGMWSVDALIAEIGNRRPQFIAMSRLLADRAYRVDQLREWLVAATGVWRADGRRHRNPFERSAAALLHPVRGDAATAGEGLRLGPLGSIIVSEVIFGALASDPRSAGGDALAGQLADSPANTIRRMYFRKFPTSQAWRSWWSSPPKLPICSRPCLHFCEAELFRLTQPGGVRRCSASKGYR